MTHRPSCFASPRLVGRDCDEKGGHAVYAAEPIAAGEMLVVFGGSVLPADQLSSLTSEERRRVLQIDDELYLFSDVESTPDWVNHCCEPNAGLLGQVVLVALRDIEAGEEICYDYAMSDGSAYDHFECRCGRAACRGQVTGDDWKLEALWSRYRGHFSPYLASRIARLQAGRRRIRHVPRRVRATSVGS
jgi:hypothetical protein